MQRNLNRNPNRRGIRKNNRTKKSSYQLAQLTTFSNLEKSAFTFLDPHKFITMKYSDEYSFSLATITGSSQIMNLNSLFDPDRSGVGHQPYGYDTITPLYSRYRVWSAHWKVTFHASTSGYYVVVLPSNGNLATAITNQASFTLACESPRAVVRSQSTGAQSVVLTGRIDLNELNGTTIEEYKGDDRFQAQNNASPSEILLLNIGAYNQNTGSIPVDFIVEMWYECEWHDPIMQAQS